MKKKQFTTTKLINYFYQKSNLQRQDCAKIIKFLSSKLATELLKGHNLHLAKIGSIRLYYMPRRRVYDSIHHKHMMTSPSICATLKFSTKFRNKMKDKLL